MSCIRLSTMRSLRDLANSLLQTHPFHTQITNHTFTKYVVQAHGRPFCCIDHRYHSKARYMRILTVNDIRGLGPESPMDINGYASNRVNSLLQTMPNSYLRKSFPMISMTYLLKRRSYSSFFSGKGNESTRADTTAASGASDPNITDSGLTGHDWFDKVKHGWESAMDAATFTGQKAKEASSGLTPYFQQLLDANPYLKEVVVPISYTLTGTVLAWFVMPRVMRRFHNYAMQGPAGKLVGDVPYEKSFWCALEDPVRYLITFMAFSQIGMMVAPTTIASQYIAPAWRGAVILSFVWFLYRWKTNVLARALASQSLAGLNREKLLTLDKLSSIGLFALGIMALAEACGVAVQSILTVGGIGGVATAFAARDVLGNVLSGLSMQFAKPFSLGDTIKAGSIEGQVVEMGLTTTSLLNAEKFPVIVPNSLFSSQVIVNKSRAQWRAIVFKIPLHIDTLDKIPKISEDIKTMLESNTNIFLGKERPYCYLSRIDISCAELTVGCNLKLLSKGILYTAQQDILLQSVQIIKNHEGALGINTLPE